MIVVLDTTAFENGFNARSAEVPLLKSFLASTSSELCIPEVVQQEAINHVRKGIKNVNSEINSVHRLTGGAEGFEKVDPESAVRAYKDSLDALLRDLKARVVPLPTVGHAELLKRALAPTKPFVEGGRGYRDALIWYTLVEILEANPGAVVFISQNSGDWCGKEKEKDVFHLDFISELQSKGLSRERLSLVPTLADFNRKYTVSSLAVAPTLATEKEKPIDYTQLLVDAKELIANQLLIALPDSLRRIGANIAGVGEFGVLGLSSPHDVQNEPPRILDSERRLLQFSAEYRLSVDLIIRGADAPWWARRFSFQLRREWDFDHIDAYITVPIKATFHLIAKGENTEQFSLASAEVLA